MIMVRKDTIKTYKEVFRLFEDGVKSQREIMRIKSLDENSKDVLYKLRNLIIETNILSEETKLYLIDKSATYNSVSKKLGINMNTVQSKIFYDINRRLVDNFGVDTITKILDGMADEELLKITIKKIEELTVKNNAGYGIIKSINVEIRVNENLGEYEVDEEEFKDCMDSLMIYTKKHMKAVTDTIPDYLGNYIVKIMGDKGQLNDTELKHREWLKNLFL